MRTRGARVHRPTRGTEADAAMTRGARLKQTVSTRFVDTHGGRYSDEALAQRAGVSVNTVRNLWHGTNAEFGTLLGVASAAGMSVLDLFTAMQGQPVKSGREPMDRIADALEEISRKLTPPIRPAWSLAEREQRLREADEWNRAKNSGGGSSEGPPRTPRRPRRTQA